MNILNSSVAGHGDVPVVNRVAAVDGVSSGQNSTKLPPPQLLPLLQKLKEVYLLWYGYYHVLPKIHRHTLGQKIDMLFIDAIEGISVASFLGREEKLPWIKFAVRKIDTSKVLLMVLWETHSIDTKKYIALSVKIEGIGKMLGGWSGQITRQLARLQMGQVEQM